MLEPLHFERHDSMGGRPFNLYECEHITRNTYPIEQVLAVGEYTNIILCKHCWQQAKGYFFEEIVQGAVKRLTVEGWKELLAESPYEQEIMAAPEYSPPEP
jgi:hypothetical protein